MADPDREQDVFRPPAIPTQVQCLHCGEEYESYLIEWREETHEGETVGFWCCPTAGCDGKGFGFDILPTDPEYRDENGELVWQDDGYDGGEDDEEMDEEMDDALDAIEQELDLVLDLELDPEPGDQDEPGEQSDTEQLPW